MTDIYSNPDLVDITKLQKSSIKRSIDSVGMKGIECPIRIQSDIGLITIPASCDALISLDDVNAKGIHMSRLYRILQEHLSQNELSSTLIESCLEHFISSHKTLSSSAELRIRFEYILKQQTLKSDSSAFRYYPLLIKAKKSDNLTQYELNFSITYSSTCPCSAALARQAIQDKFRADFSSKNTLSKEEIELWLMKEDSILATPHAQRSHAHFSLLFKENFDFNIAKWIHEAETIIQTAVQALVKREDEKEFAIKNGQNLMFCEDSVRRFDAWLDAKTELQNFTVTVDHYESLHPHNASASTTKKQ